MTEPSAEEIIAKRNKLQKEVASWQQKAAVAAADEERIKKEIAAALTELKETFGCSTFEEAIQKRDALTEELQGQLQELEGRLDALRDA